MAEPIPQLCSPPCPPSCYGVEQVPQFILDDPDMGPTCRMAVTQPRRISAIAVAERIASERMEEVGKVVGYNIRLETEVSDATQVRATMVIDPGREAVLPCVITGGRQVESVYNPLCWTLTSSSSSPRLCCPLPSTRR